MGADRDSENIMAAPGSVERHKQTATQLFACFTAGDIDGVMSTMTDDATWWVPGKPDLNPAAGLYSRARIERLFRAMLKRLDGGLRMAAKGMVGEGDRLAVEAVSEGDLIDGRLYRQEYHMLMAFRDGRICAVREYLDTQHAHAIWVATGPTPQAPAAATRPAVP